VDGHAGIRASKTVCAQLLQFPEGGVHFEPVSHRSIAVSKPAVDFRPRKQGVAARDFVWMRTVRNTNDVNAGRLILCVGSFCSPLVRNEFSGKFDVLLNAAGILSLSLAKRAETTYAEYRLQKESALGASGFRLPL
jgi:hypothetical protein